LHNHWLRYRTFGEVEIIIVARVLLRVVFQGTLEEPRIVLKGEGVFVTFVADQNIVAWSGNGRLERPVKALNFV
jgi:hypothetical protein